MWFNKIVSHDSRGKSKGPLSYFMSEWNLGGVQRDLKYFEAYPNNNNDEIIDLCIDNLQDTIEYLKLLKTTATPAEQESFIKKITKKWKKLHT